VSDNGYNAVFDAMRKSHLVKEVVLPDAPVDSVLDYTVSVCQEAQQAMQRLVVQLAVLANNRNIPPKIGNMASLLWRWACTEKECVEQIRSELIDLNKKEVF
jgi:hypothetical protein